MPRTAESPSPRRPRDPSSRTTTASPATVMVAGDSAADLQVIVERLSDDHDRVVGSLDPLAAVRDFEALLPQVIVLGFDTIQKSDHYLLSLYRESQLASRHRHRTVLLCSQSEVAAAYGLCKKGCYDEYVLYWPMAQDGLRLSMSVWLAVQAVLAETAQPDPRQQIARHAGQVAEVQQLLAHELVEGRLAADTLAGALDQVESAVDQAIDQFGRRVTTPAPGTPAAVSHPAAFGSELDQLKRVGVHDAFVAGAKTVEAATAWPASATQRLESVARQVRDLAGAVPKSRATLMIVEDDEVQRELIAAALEGGNLELIMLPDGASLIGAIRRRKPSMILMDINLPDIDGVALTRTLRGQPRLSGVPVLMLTGEASRESLAKSIEAGAVGYIVKPFTRETLLKNIERFLPPTA